MSAAACTPAGRIWFADPRSPHRFIRGGRISSRKNSILNELVRPYISKDRRKPLHPKAILLVTAGILSLREQSRRRSGLSTKTRSCPIEQGRVQSEVSALSEGCMRVFKAPAFFVIQADSPRVGYTQEATEEMKNFGACRPAAVQLKWFYLVRLMFCEIEPRPGKRFQGKIQRKQVAAIVPPGVPRIV